MIDTKTELKKLIPLYCKEFESVDVSKYNDYQFSEKYIKNKEQLIKRQNRVYYPLVKTTGRKVASVAVAAALMGTITVAAYEPAREAVKDFFVRIFKGYSVVTTSKDSKTIDSHKQKIEYQYKIDVPDEFILSEDETVATDTYVSFSYYTEDRSKCLYFNQYTGDSYKSYVDNEHSVLSKKTDNFGNEILVYNYGDVSVTIIWDNGEYVFDLSGDMSEAEIMKIYYTVK